MPQRLKEELSRLERDIQWGHRVGVLLLILGALCLTASVFFWSLVLFIAGVLGILSGAGTYEIAEEMELIYHKIEERMKQI